MVQFTRKSHVQNQKLFLFILTGDQRGIAEEVRPKRERITNKVRVPAFIAKLKPEVLQEPKRKTRSHPVNAYMNEDAVRRKDAKFKTHSHMIHEIAASNGSMRIMKNGTQTKSDSFRESPCHRNMRPGENPNVGPAPNRN